MLHSGQGCASEYGFGKKCFLNVLPIRKEKHTWDLFSMSIISPHDINEIWEQMETCLKGELHWKMKMLQGITLKSLDKPRTSFHLSKAKFLLSFGSFLAPAYKRKHYWQSALWKSVAFLSMDSKLTKTIFICVAMLNRCPRLVARLEGE